MTQEMYWAIACPSKQQLFSTPLNLGCKLNTAVSTLLSSTSCLNRYTKNAVATGSECNVTEVSNQADVTVSAWGEYAIAQVPQWFSVTAGQVTRHNIVGLNKVASNRAGDQVLILTPATGEVTIQRAGRFILCGSTYVQGSIQNANPNATVDVMGAIVIRIPPNPSPNPGITTHELRLGQNVVALSPAGNLQDSGFSFSGGTTLMLPGGTKISLRVGIFADNLSTGQFLKWQARADSAASGANLSIHEIAGGL